jgi:hypothetical protein
VEDSERGQRQHHRHADGDQAHIHLEDQRDGHERHQPDQRHDLVRSQLLERLYAIGHAARVRLLRAAGHRRYLVPPIEGPAVATSGGSPRRSLSPPKRTNTTAATTVLKAKLAKNTASSFWASSVSASASFTIVP